MRPVKVGLLGLGTVGCGTVNVLERNGQEITRRAGREIEVTRAAAREPSRVRGCATQGITLTADPFDVVNAPDVDIVVELIGGYEPAHELVRTAIERGKHVVTANKALIALHGNDLFARAQEQGVMIAFEAAVAGGIPIIKAIREGLAGNTIEWLAGIINGTGNFIMTEMASRSREFDDVLAEAQRLGYAESDPSFDIDGVDAAHKLTILASIAFGIPLQFEQVYTQGIREVTRDDVANAAYFGYRVKHLGIARRGEGGVELRVHPTLIPEARLIANVDGVMNAVLVYGDAVGPTLYYGAGAGADPTASAVVADLVDVARALTSDPTNRVPHLAFQPDAISDQAILPMDAVRSAYYLRLHAVDRPGVLADVTHILGERGISIEAMLQKTPAEGAEDVPVIMLTNRIEERFMREAIARIEQLEAVQGRVMMIRVESLAG